MLRSLVALSRLSLKTLRCALLLLLLALPALLSAQSTIILGRASVQLTGPWRFHVGDNPAWAQPGFDDARWSMLDLTPPSGSSDPYNGSSGFVPGWTARGYAGYSGFAWYRLRVNLQGGAPGGIALKMPDDIDDAYQVFANGQFIGEFGSFHVGRVTSYVAQPRAFTLPAGMSSGPVTIAIRMWMDPHTVLVQSAAGGLHAPPVLGEGPVVLAMLRLDWDTVDRSTFSVLPVAAILLLAIAVGFTLFALDRTEHAYLWLAINSIVILLIILVSDTVYHTTLIPAILAVFLRDVILLPTVIALWVLFWACWFRLYRRKELGGIVWALVALEAFGTALQRAPLYGHLLPVDSLVWISPLAFILKLLLGALLFGVTWRGFLKSRTEGLLALPAVALIAIAQYQYELQLFHTPIYFFAFGYTISISQIATVLSLGIITALLLRRFLQSQRAREQWRLEIEQARQVQNLLIPEQIPSVDGFVLESDYRPALQVGGDFFQFMPGPDDSFLVVIGDVSGKGLRAAMLVSLIVGTVRTLAAFSRNPAEILSGINDRLCGRLNGQFATCLALHIARDGKTTVANAGHIPPLWNGREMTFTGSLPLGLVPGAPVEEITLTLEAGDRLILLTDGIVEAQDRNQELFGFDRTAEMAKRNCSAIELASAAEEFGQEDDITVLRIERVSVDAVESPASAQAGSHPAWATCNAGTARADITLA